MLPRNNLINDPENYQPLSSIKSIRNKPSEKSYADVNLLNIFISPSNKALLTATLHKTMNRNGYQSPIATYATVVHKAMIEFCRRTQINKYTTTEDYATEQRNWVEALRVVNQDFLKFCYNLFKWNKTNPFREWVEVGDSEDRRQTKMTELTAEEIPTIDVWAHQEIQLMNNKFRDHNKIPFWQSSMNTRHYDRANDGLHQNDPDRASLDNPIYGYDMTKIENALDKWTETSWFGL